MDHFVKNLRRFYVPKRASDVIALVALSTTLFLFLHTSQLRERLRVAQQSAPASASAPSMHQQETMVAATPGVYPSSQANYGMSRLVSAIVQPSLELLNDQEDVRTLNITGRAGQQLVFFNRVPKVGSQTLMELIRRLAQRNAFAFHRDRVQRVETIRLAPDDEERLAQMVSNLEAPGVYVKHVCYTNFTKYGFPEPIYMNIVRDPVERVISWYYYIRAPWYYVERKRAFPDLPLPDPNWLKKDFETCVLRGDRECRYIEGETREGIGDHRRQSLFFCGHDEECTPFNTAEALARAKAAVERHYAVVGVLEEFNVTLSVLERYMPRFFAGASDIYWGEGVNSINRNLYKPPVSEAIKDIVRANFTRETEFYQFCKQRLHRQYRALNLV